MDLDISQYISIFIEESKEHLQVMNDVLLELEKDLSHTGYINEIFRVLKPGGILITDLLSIEDDSFGLGEEIEKNTFVGGREGEEGIPHFYTTDKEIKEFFKKFDEVKVSKTDYIFELIDGKEFISKAFDICCLKG